MTSRLRKYVLASLVSSLVIILYLAGCSVDTPKTNDELDVKVEDAKKETPKIVDNFFAAPSTAKSSTSTLAEAAETLTIVETELPTPKNENALLHSWFKPVDDNDDNDETYSVALYFDGLADFEHGFSSFQIWDVNVPECTELDDYSFGEMLGPNAYPFISHGVIGSKAGKSYTARFGGFGSSRDGVKTDGHLLTLHFIGRCSNNEELSLDDYRFNVYNTELAMAASPVHPL